ncbi:hypothetical protein F4818DRAFT_433839 [Hypoxylon cercidicola]|nr:hypothetical protein F4818DRAFT_433839 [Hypoxylon cercidicola]
MNLSRRMLGYLPVPNSEGVGRKNAFPAVSGHHLHLFLSIISCALGIFIGAAINRQPPCVPGILQQPSIGSSSPPDIPLDVINVVFVYNRTFGEDPWHNSSSDEAWDSIVPLGRGSIRYPPGSSGVYTLSVVHQLHCLWSIHRSYFAMLDSDSEANDETAMPHMRHCFDYLRQSLTCASDATLEPVDPALGGVTGWGNPRLCRDYESVTAWAEQHRVNNLSGFRESHVSHNGHQP